MSIPWCGEAIGVAAFLDLTTDNPPLVDCQPGLSWVALAMAHWKWVAQYQMEYLGGGVATPLPITLSLVLPLTTLPNPLSPVALTEGTNVSEENKDCVDDGKVF